MADTAARWSGEVYFIHLKHASPGKKRKIIEEINKSLGFNDQAVREWKHADRLRCPRCDPEHGKDIVCNGKAKPGSDRQRYLCRNCGRSFNDRTGTVLHKSRKAEWWPAFLKCLLDGKSVREIAKDVGISPTTAQAWRRKLLSHLAERTSPTLKGIVEYTELSVKTSSKGQKTGHSPGSGQRETVVFCKSRSGGVYVGHGRQWNRHREWSREEILWHTDLPKPALMPENASPTFPVCGAQRRLLHARRAAELAEQFSEMYAKMRGTATRYLPLYAAWHQFQDQNRHVAPRDKILRLLISGL
jgi:transposase-like protein